MITGGGHPVANTETTEPTIGPSTASGVGGNSRHSCKCFEHDHIGRIESLEQQVTKLSQALVRCMNGTPIAPDSDVARNAKWEADRDERKP